MLRFLADNWVILAGIASGAAFLLERTFHFIADRKKKAQAYNHCLLSLVKLQFAYTKQKEQLVNPQLRQLEPSVFHAVLSLGNDLQAQLIAFNVQMAKEAALVPELILQANVMSNLVERLFLVEKVYAGNSLNGALTDEMINTIYSTQRALLDSAAGRILDRTFYEMARIAVRHGSLSSSYRARLLHLFDPANAGEIAALSNEFAGDFMEKLQGETQPPRSGDAPAA